MAEFADTSENLLRTVLTGISDRIAGRPFKQASPAFFGTPDEPSDSYATQTADQAPGAVAGADLSAPETPTVENRTGSLAWGGHANGHIPAEEMTSLGHGQYLENEAATAWQRLVAAAERDGIDISITDSYRSYDAQVRVRREKGHLVATATPGTSNHGWGRAVDANVNDPKALAWLRANAEKYGWINPAWAQKAGKSYEPWHWEYRAKPTQQVPAGTQQPEATQRPVQTPTALDFPLPAQGRF